MDAEFEAGINALDVLGRTRMFVFHKPLTTHATWRDWERELWKLIRADPPERRLWATVLAQALADVYRGRAEVAQAAWIWMTQQPRLLDAKRGLGPMVSRVGAYEWITNELDLPMRRLRQNVYSDIHDRKTRARIVVP